MQGRLLARPPSGALELVLCIVPLLCYPPSL